MKEILLSYIPDVAMFIFYLVIGANLILNAEKAGGLEYTIAKGFFLIGFVLLAMFWRMR